MATRIEVEDEKGRDVKLLLHKFLDHEGLDGYRVLSDSWTLKVVPYDDSTPEEPAENDKIKGIPPFLLVNGETPVDARSLPELRI